MKKKIHTSSLIFNIFNYSILTVLAALCLIPFIHLLALSLSVNTSATAGEVGLLPIGFTLRAYEFVFKNGAFIRSFGISCERVILSLVISVSVIILAAYPLSKNSSKFKSRSLYTWFFVITMFFSGGLMPLYVVIRNVGIIDSIWALVLPMASPAFYILIMLSFFQGVPNEVEEAAIVDGANQFRILFRIFIPISKPAIATIALFTMVLNWNSWFDGLLYMNSSAKYPLQSYLQTLTIQPAFQLVRQEDIERLKNLSNLTVKSAQVFIGALPMLAVYPFIQKYFVTGITLGAVKG